MLYRNSFSAPVFGLRREIDRLFEDTFGRGEGMNSWSPAVDVRESDKEVRLEVELPGINPEEVEVTADNGILTVRGEKKTERKEGDDESRYHVVERSYGSFMRSFQLPQGLDESKIEADYNNGILAIHIPKAALPQPRKIQIGSSKQGQVNAGSTRQAQVTSGPSRQSNGQNADKNGRSTKSETSRPPEMTSR